MAPLVVGLSGTTNSGKTTVSNRLKEVLPNLTVFNMDDYYREENDEKHILLPEFNNYANWEIESAVNFDRLVSDVKRWKEAAEKMEYGLQTVLIIEGIIIYKCRRIVELCDVKYFITLPKAECWDRRRLRHYLPPEPPGYFEAICWPEYLNHKEELTPFTDIVYVDGMRSQEELFRVIHDGISTAWATTQ